MQILPVLDLKGGVVVRGVAGRRDEYRPIQSKLCHDASPASVADALRATFGFAECYVADLDALGGAPPDTTAFAAIERAGLRPWIDAGATAVETRGNDLPGATTIVGLESIADEPMLRRLADCVGPDRLVFSLDLKDGRPLTTSAAWAVRSPEDIAACAVAIGVRTMIVLDLAGVGVGAGVPTLDLCRRLRARFPLLRLVSGGGVRDSADLRSLHEAGCDGALVASALHDGRLSAADVRAAMSFHAP